MKITLLVILFLVMIVGVSPVFAQTTHVVKIPTGAANPDAPYFYSVQNTGNTKGIVQVFPNDSVVWKNADTVEHTVVAETLDNSAILFDSDLIGDGEQFQYTFTELGVYEYFCKLHPWMSGTVNVIKNPGQVKTLKNVASGYEQYGVGFSVRYILDTNISNSVDVNPDKKTLTFYLTGKTQNDKITLMLPTQLIENPNSVWVDDSKINDFSVESTSDGTRLIIPLNHSPEKITIMGSYVVPEFEIALVILLLGVLSIVGLSRKFNWNKTNILSIRD